ncbi:MAG: hypothetical protein BWX88_00684 [Planctomycetes bacterium ADurb.Bin126]|nr:MAG: hypothetical protein BWX88_00684 [Planctomycetes bacterium ADurb.Bin126]HOD83969.1 type II toxin-antitoxin system VapC family toxin [Phycisphaerae bacterium]HQL72498.1 type II toxin-antitoxin system VapC family toxin [Phycisphaerae bacterium]
MKQRVYIETTIVSYLTAKPSRELILRAHQDVTREWWSEKRELYDLFTSQLVLDEASDGDAEAAADRLALLAGMSQVPVTPSAMDLAEELLNQGLLPTKAATDAAHLALAVLHNMDILLTWNCRHLANAAILGRIGDYVRSRTYRMPIVCTPDELAGDVGEHGA